MQTRKDLYSLERTVEEMEKERKLLENSLCQQNIKNTSLQDEITDLKRRNVNVENRFKSELEAGKQKVILDLCWSLSISFAFQDEQMKTFYKNRQICIYTEDKSNFDYPLKLHILNPFCLFSGELGPYRDEHG